MVFMEILKALYKYEKLTRQQLSKLLNVTIASISMRTAKLLENGLITEETAEITVPKTGPKEKILQLNENYGIVLGINFEQNRTSIGICNLKNRILDNSVVDKSSNLQKIINISKKMLHKWADRDLLACGVTVVGKVDSESGISESSLGLFPENFSIGKYFEEVFKVPVLVQNNVRAIALAERHYYRDEQTENFLFLKYGPGLSCALVTGDYLLKGRDNYVGEIGHTVLSGSYKKCRCGKTGCLEAEISEEAILEGINNYKEFKSIEDFYKAIQDGDKIVADYFERKIKFLSLNIANLYILFGGLKIILFGRIFLYSKIRDMIFRQISEIYCSEKILNDLIISKMDITKSFLGATNWALLNGVL